MLGHVAADQTLARPGLARSPRASTLGGMAMFASESTGHVWGDGFHDDEWRHVLAVKSWDRCHPDEMIRVFPNLLRDSQPSDAVRLRLAECVSVLASRCQNSSGRDGYEPRSVGPDAIETGRHAAARWFPAVGKLARWLPRPPSRSQDQEHAALILLDSVALAVAEGALRPFDPACAMEVAYWCGLHPVYLWREAFSEHALFTAIGWIGHAERYGRALMTRDIAEFFMDSLGCVAGHRGEIRDTRLLAYIRSDRTAKKIRSAASRTLAGESPVVRLRPEPRDLLLKLAATKPFDGVFPGSDLRDDSQVVGVGQR